MQSRGRRSAIRSRRPAEVLLLWRIGRPFSCAKASGCTSRTYCCFAASIRSSTCRIFLHDVKSLFRDADAHSFAVQAQGLSERLGGSACRAGGENTLLDRGQRRSCRAAASQTRGSLSGTPIGMSMAIVDAGVGEYRIKIRRDLETQVAQIRSRPRDNPSAAAPVDSAQPSNL